MAEVNAADFTLINRADDVFPVYRGVGREMRIGIEVELAMFDPSRETLPIMNVKQNSILKDMARDVMPGDWLRNEPTSETIEVNSIAENILRLRSVLDDTNHKINILTDTASRIGLKRSFFQELPDKSADELLSSIVDVDRYKAFFVPYRDDMRGFAEYFSVCKSTQVSVSYKDIDHLFKNIRRLYLLAPFLFLLTDNSSGFIQGRPYKGHGGMALRHKGLLENRGGVPSYVFLARTSSEFLDRHINHVMNNPLFVYYDEKGDLRKIPSGQWTSFEKLKECELNTASNYYLGQSVLWPDIKIAPLKNDLEQIYAHRYEARMFGVGLHQHQTASLIVGSLAIDENFAQQIDTLLASYGFTLSDDNTVDLLMKSYKAARNHQGKFFEVTYGNGKMLDFAKNFADLIEPVLDAMGFEEEMQPLLVICRSGYTDAKINRILFPTMEDIVRFQMNYDQNVFRNSNLCGRLLFEKELRQEKDRLSLSCGCA